MKLYIQIVDNRPVNHPILEENLLMIFSEIELYTGQDYVPFIRVENPVLGPYDKNVHHSYELIEGIAKDVWTVDRMNEHEILEKQNQTKTAWQQNGHPSWTFNETTCEFEPPVLYPSDNRIYGWSEEDTNWIEISTD